MVIEAEPTLQTSYTDLAIYIIKLYNNLVGLDKVALGALYGMRKVRCTSAASSGWCISSGPLQEIVGGSSGDVRLSAPRCWVELEAKTSIKH